MTNNKDTTSGGFFQDFGMFSCSGNAVVSDIVQEAVHLTDDLSNPTEQAIEYMFEELKYLSEHFSEFKEANNTAVRNAALTEFFKEKD